VALTGTGLGTLRAASRDLQAQLVALRSSLHQSPELGLWLPDTQALILNALRELELPVILGRTSSSIVAEVSGRRYGPTVVLRADMDALPVTERAEVGPVSRIDGRMHACGHDLHSAMLVGAAHLLAARRNELAGRVVLVWQPGEEGHNGMQMMLDDGLLDVIGPDAVASYALHTLTDAVPHGVFTGRGGASHASTGSFTVTVRGQGGHAAFPHQAVDPVPAAAELVLALQVRLTRTVDVFDPAVVSVGTIHAGTAPNVIPAEARLQGTVRTFSPAQATWLPQLIQQTAEGVAMAYGVEISVEYEAGYPAVVNDEGELEVFRSVIGELFGPDRFAPLRSPVPAGDDYSRLLEQVPGAFVLLGAGLPAADGLIHPNHSSGAVFDESLLADGAAALAAVALHRLRTAQARKENDDDATE
jgi:hippurate hydrolase